MKMYDKTIYKKSCWVQTLRVARWYIFIQKIDLVLKAFEWKIWAYFISILVF
jgi:hypothetical protein